MLRFYAYKGCDGCRKARNWLNDHGIVFEEIPVRDQPPTVAELRQAADQLGLKAIFNTSGMDYRQRGMKDKLPNMSEDEALQELHTCGNLVKRPFLIGENICLAGFKEDVWTEALS
ncbi:ArsC family transcriptional regulator [Oceaniferula spumae]|uniref:ArsC family transcriptional regulator n=1 Tax=Oceaniferula spumae TaxID=2979115 RepID=A0AAT9FRN1_9BACT